MLMVLTLGSVFSAGAAHRGAEWAARRLKQSRNVAIGLLVIGVVLGILIQPVWVGLSIAYLAFVVWILGRTVLRRIQLVDQVAVDPAYAMGVVKRTRIGLLILALVLGVIAAGSWGSTVAWIIGGAAVVMAVAGGAMFRTPAAESDL